MNEALKELFQRHFGESAEKIDPIKGDGSGRMLFRLSGRRHVAVGAVAADEKENRAFLDFSRHFRQCGLPVPEIYAEDLARSVYLEEDLGDTTLFRYLTSQRTQESFPKAAVDVYRQVVKILPKFQITAGKTLNYKVCYPRASFDRQSMTWDLNYFKYYFLRLAKIPFDEQALENDFKRFVEFLLEADRDYFLYRDFQSRNIMVKDGAPYFIDYQGGRKGALQYDIASLLSDAKANIPFDIRTDLLRHYLDAASALIKIDRKEFMKYYHGFVYIRIMQACGAYGLRGFYERKIQFLESIPYAIRNIEHLLRFAELPVELPALMQVFKRLVAASSLRQFGQASLKLTVRVQSFSYRDGVPQDEKGHGGGFVFDCRALPNPGRQKALSPFTGKDREIIEFLEKEPTVGRFLNHVFALVDQSVEDYQSRNFTDLVVAFGCTGGQHRSVYCAERLARHLKDNFKINVQVNHCCLAKLNAEQSGSTSDSSAKEKRAPVRERSHAPAERAHSHRAR